MKNCKILFISPENALAASVKRYHDRFAGANIVPSKDNEENIFANAPGANAIIGCPRNIFSADLLRVTGSSLKWIHATGAGCEEFMIPELVESDIIITNGRIIQGPEVADHALALLLALTRGISFLLKGGDPSKMPRPIELRGKIVAIFGVGGIGMCIAERCAGFGMKVVGIDENYQTMLSFFDDVVRPREMIDVLKTADVVICAAPSTARSYKLFGSEQFEIMKKDVFFINVSRGKLVDTQALVKYLNNGKFAGVGLDVSDPEPLPKDHALHSFDRVLLTPHIAGISDHNRQRSLDLIELNICNFLHGKPLVNVVNKQLGY